MASPMENCDDSAVLEVSSEDRNPLTVKNESRDSVTDVSNITNSINDSLVSRNPTEKLCYLCLLTKRELIHNRYLLQPSYVKVLDF